MKSFIFAFLSLGMSTNLLALDTITIISPHRKSIQQEFIPKVKEAYKKKYKTELEVQWLDQGGTSDDIRFVRARFAKHPKSSGIDIFWGGGAAVFFELQKDGFLSPYKLSKGLSAEIPQTIAGVSLYDKTHTWYGSAMSSFGIFYNKPALKMEGLPEPKTWSDLASPKFFKQLSLADPRRSGSARTMSTIILESLGWEKGWEMLTAISANTRKFTHSSSDPIKAVVSGDAVAAMAIDFYANAKVSDIGSKNLGFVLPEGHTVLDPDPVAILKGAPNRKAAGRFIELILSKDIQKLLVLPKGADQGPRFASLGRMSVNKATYKETEGKRATTTNPFTMSSFLKLDIKKIAKTQRLFTDLIGAVLIDTHHELQKAWKAIIKRGNKPEDLVALAKVPLTEKQMLELSEKWDDNLFRNKTINEWVQFSRAKFKKIAKGN